MNEQQRDAHSPESNSSIPRDKSPDSTAALMSEGYTFVSSRCRRYQTDVFQTRLMLQKTICMMGEDAAKLFYDTERFQRKGAAPRRLRKILLGEGTVQGMDGDAHRRRKNMFMSLMTPEGINHLADLADDLWHAYLAKWEKVDQAVLYHEVGEIIGRAVAAWAGIPIQESEVEQRSTDLRTIVDGAGAIGPRYWRGRRARARTDRWLAELVAETRAHKLEPPEGSALHAIALHRDLDGKLLDKKAAAGELNNVLRATDAVARFITFAALALHEHPECRQKLRAGEDGYLDCFVQEVRRFYSFFPAIMARVRKDFDWNGYHFPKGTRTLLDLYGTDHDARIWENPETFRPERFRDWDGGAFNLIPQGGGDHYIGHRCAGEWIAIEFIKRAVTFLTTSIEYDVPDQDLRIDLTRMPTIPQSRFIIRNVRPT